MALFGFKKKEKEKKVAEKDTVLVDAGKEEAGGEVVSVKKEIESGVPKKQAVKKSSKRKGEIRHKTSSGGYVLELENVLVRPRITEKATFAAEHGVYVFEVASSANKYQIARAIERFYNVSPRKVNIVRIPEKRIRSRMRGRFGVVSSGKKAYVYLKEGDTIEIV